MLQSEGNSVGIYVRISRDEHGENFETVENQRDMLFDFVAKHRLGRVYSVYLDDNVSGSAFDRRGLDRLKDDILNGRIDLLVMKDLSRLGRNNAKTLQWLDFIEEYGVRILTFDGRYDSRLDNDTVGIETWANERYIRDISRKIRSCLRYKIRRGEYLGNAPFGYRKSNDEKNRLILDEAQAEVVRLIYRLYRTGLGYSSIASRLDERCVPPPKGACWNRITVRRILISRVYIGDTVQGVSEKVSFKSKKTRRLPKEDWVVTEGTHEGIVSKDEFMEAQRLRERKRTGNGSYRSSVHLLSDVVRCGGCGNTMYVRKGSAGIAYICGNYFRNGRDACTSHFVYEDQILGRICKELIELTSACDIRNLVGIAGQLETGVGGKERSVEKMSGQLDTCRRHQDMLYRDRLEGRISGQLFDRMNTQYEKRIDLLEKEVKRLGTYAAADFDASASIGGFIKKLERTELSKEVIRLAINKITVYDKTDPSYRTDCGDIWADSGSGAIIIDFDFHIA